MVWPITGGESYVCETGKSMEVMGLAVAQEDSWREIPITLIDGSFGLPQKRDSKPEPFPSWLATPLASDEPFRKPSHTRALRHSRRSLYSCRCASTPARKSGREKPAVHALR